MKFPQNALNRMPDLGDKTEGLDRSKDKLPVLKDLEKESLEKRHTSLDLKAEIVNFNNGHSDVPNTKEIHLKNGDELAGFLVFMQNPNEKSLKVSEIALTPNYHGLGIGMNLYDELVSYAKENNFTKIKSGFSVRGGALVAWIRLSEKYKIEVNPKIKRVNGKSIDFNEVIQMYKDKKLPKDYNLGVPPEEGVFELIVE